jgi:hypothetical protein
VFVKAQCVSCHEFIGVEFSLADLFKACPAPNLPARVPLVPPLKQEVFTEEDKNFLGEFHIGDIPY